MQESTPRTPQRRPPALLPASAARLGGFAALALLGASQWQRMVVGLSWGHALLWVLVAVAAAVGILWADSRRRFRGALTLGVTVAALVAAYAASGLSLALLKPRRLDELGAGLSHGTESLASVQMPYRGADPWPSLTLQLLGALLCVLAALLAFWPRGNGSRGYQFLALALLLVLVAAPVVSIGGTRPVVLGLVLTALTVCFLWLERLPLQPGLGIAAMLALALAGALPLASAANGEQPWFDYKAFAESLGPDDPVQFNWNHTYGDITWPRDGAEVLRVDTRRPSYWKVADLDDFDGEAWIDTGSERLGTTSPEFDLPDGWQGQPAVARHAARHPAADRDRHGDRGRDDARGPRHRPAPSSRAATRGSGARPRRSAAATRTASRPSRRGRTRSSSPRRPPGSTRGIRPS